MGNADISIIIPVYNVEKFLDECINSVLNQTLKNIEIIIVNDGSTDNSGRICDGYKLQDERITVIHKENNGLSTARNTGILSATGKYIFFLDSDDILLGEGCLAEINNKLIEYSPDVACCLVEKINEKSDLINDKYPPFVNSNAIYNGKEILLEFDYRVITMAQNKICKRTLCLEKNLFFCDGLYHEDDEWIPRVLSEARSFIYINTYAYGYRQREDSIISSSDESRILKKAIDKVTVTRKSIEYIQTKWNDDVFLRGKAIQYYFTYFISSVVKYYILNNPENKKALFDHLFYNWTIINYMKYSISMNHKIVYLINRIFGQRITMKILKLRYTRLLEK